MRNYTLAFAILALSAGGTLAAQTDTEHVRRTEKLPTGGTLRVRNFSGRVSIAADDRADVEIDAVRRGSRTWLDRSTLDVHTDGSTLVIDANQTDRSWLIWSRRNRPVETDLEIKVPRHINLDINVFSSPVTITGVEGAQKLHGFSSRLKLDGVSGSVQAHTFSGAVEIRANTWVENQSIDVDTFSGNVQLHVPESARGTLTFNSFSGRLNSAMPLTLHSSSRRSLRAELGGGTGGTLHFKTFSGSVRIDR
jgi:Putative adhesin